MSLYLACYTFTLPCYVTISTQLLNLFYCFKSCGNLTNTSKVVAHVLKTNTLHTLTNTHNSYFRFYDTILEHLF